jgi:hypothetical protein
VDVGCWKKGSEVKGNTTWVQMVNPGTVNCYISPDQWDPTEWHGKSESAKAFGRANHGQAFQLASVRSKHERTGNVGSSTWRRKNQKRVELEKV